MLFASRILYLIVCTASALEYDINSLNNDEFKVSTKTTQKPKCKPRKGLNVTRNILPKKHLDEEESIESEIVSIYLYYETLCPYSVDFYTTSFVSVVEKLSPYLNITTNPYGLAKTLKRKGKYRFTCQHGPEECYGNKLHACTIDLLQNITQAVLFNSCMMKTGDSDGSNDKAADECSKEQNIDAASIKECAKGAKGTELLKEYGDASKSVNLHRVPWIFINGHELNSRRHFMRQVCAAYTNPPPPCQK